MILGYQTLIEKNEKRGLKKTTEERKYGCTTQIEDPFLDVRGEIGEIISFHMATQTWEVMCRDSTIIDLDIYQLEYMIRNSKTGHNKQETMLFIHKACYEAYLITEPQHDTPKGCNESSGQRSPPSAWQTNNIRHPKEKEKKGDGQ